MQRSWLATIAVALVSASGVVAQGDACACSGALADGVCYPTVAAAFQAVAPEGVVEFGGNRVIKQTIQFRKSLTLKGATSCGGSRATLTSKIASKEGGMLEVRGPGPLQIQFDNVAFTGDTAALRGGSMLVGPLICDAAWHTRVRGWGRGCRGVHMSRMFLGRVSGWRSACIRFRSTTRSKDSLTRRLS